MSNAECVQQDGRSQCDSAIETRGLAVSFPQRNKVVRALHPTSLRFEPETSTAIIGETGCGKSVFLMGMLGFLDRNAKVSGSVHFSGEELRSLPARRMRSILRDKIALIPQNPPESLNSRMTVTEQLTEGLNGGRRRRQARIQSELERLGLDQVTESSRTHRYPFQLSGGMQQRALVAAGTVRMPEWLIADEPTTGLDAINRADCAALLLEAKRRVGGGLIMVTHDLHLARALADRIVVMYAGRVVEDAPASTFFDGPKHPYSAGLLNALPARGAVPIPGESPTTTAWHHGCPFAARCLHVHDRCRGDLPEMYESAAGIPSSRVSTDQRLLAPLHEAGSLVRCFLYGDD